MKISRLEPVLALKQMEKLLVGQDPMRIEWIWNALTRNLHFRGSVTQAAVSGIDIALWDLKGKALGVPCYELLGGKTRNKVRIYVNARGKTDEELVQASSQLVEKGFGAIRFTVMHPENQDGACGEAFSALVHRAAGTMEAIRKAVGWDVDVSVECHRGMRPAEAIELGRAMEPFRPPFLRGSHSGQPGGHGGSPGHLPDPPQPPVPGRFLLRMQ